MTQDNQLNEKQQKEIDIIIAKERAVAEEQNLIINSGKSILIEAKYLLRDNLDSTSEFLPKYIKEIENALTNQDLTALSNVLTRYKNDRRLNKLKLAQTEDAKSLEVKESDSENSEPNTVKLAQNQKYFLEAISDANNKVWKNDLQLGNVFSQMQNNIKKQMRIGICAESNIFLPTNCGYVEGWIGKIVWLKANDQGKGRIKLSLNEPVFDGFKKKDGKAIEVTIKTHDNIIGDMSDVKTLIDANSDLFQKAIGYDVNDMVTFSGNFILDDKELFDPVYSFGNVKKKSIEKPSYIFQFKSLEKIGKISDYSKKNSKKKEKKKKVIKKKKKAGKFKKKNLLSVDKDYTCKDLAKLIKKQKLKSPIGAEFKIVILRNIKEINNSESELECVGDASYDNALKSKLIMKAYYIDGDLVYEANIDPFTLSER